MGMQLKFHDIYGTDLMMIRFQSPQTNEDVHYWIPRWDDLCNIFLQAYITELTNHGAFSYELDKFVSTSNRLLAIHEKRCHISNASSKNESERG